MIIVPFHPPGNPIDFRKSHPIPGSLLWLREKMDQCPIELSVLTLIWNIIVQMKRKRNHSKQAYMHKISLFLIDEDLSPLTPVGLIYQCGGKLISVSPSPRILPTFAPRWQSFLNKSANGIIFGHCGFWIGSFTFGRLGNLAGLPRDCLLGVLSLEKNKDLWEIISFLNN